MIKPRVIAGTVCDALGKPVANARIHFVRGPALQPGVAALTGSSGSFSLSAAAAGTYEIECTTDRAGSARATVEVRDDDVHVALKLEKP